MKKLLLTALLAANFSATAIDRTVLNAHTFEVRENLAEQAAKVQAAKEQASGGTVVAVGSTVDCHFNSGTTKIQDAIDSGADEVRIVDGTYVEGIVIDDIDLVLKGGYASCADALAGNQGASSTSTVISASDPGATILVSGTDQRNSIEIDTIRITGGTANGLAGGGITVVADAAVNLNDVWIDNNSNALGGGLSVFSGDSDIVAYNLMLFDNTGGTGGGIFCNGNDGANSVSIIGDENTAVGIVSNEATQGGGVYLNDGCRFTSYMGTSSDVAFQGISGNTSTEEGGGIYASGGSVVNLVGIEECAFIFCFGNDTRPVSVSSNDSGNLGGGIYATDSGTVVNVFNGYIRNNEALLGGGGVYVEDEAFFYANTAFKDGVDCWSPGSCSQIVGNSAGGSGGAVYVGGAGQAELFRTHVLGNRAGFGTALYSMNVDSRILSEGSLFSGNGGNGEDGFSDNNVLRARTGGTIDVRFTTIADNNIPAANEIIGNDTAITNVRSSIIHEPNAVAVIERVTPTGYDFDCVILHERDSFPGGFNVLVADPQFIDRANGDYHIDPVTSPALDFCNDGIIAPLEADIDNEERGFDWPSIPNTAGGSFDVGFDEQTDIIFVNGFEG